jgi:hypothetical protein
MKGEIAAIADELHANSVSVIGTDIHRLVDTATAALERGLHVWIQPRLYDDSQAEVLAHLARTARQAERLRKKYSGVSLNVGVESTIFTPGMVPSTTWSERIKSLSTVKLDFRAMQRRLNAFLKRASAVARKHFHGKITDPFVSREHEARLALARLEPRQGALRDAGRRRERSQGDAARRSPPPRDTWSYGRVSWRTPGTRTPDLPASRCWR